MNISQLKESKFLRKEDCGKGILVTIDRIEQHNVAPSGQPEENKFCLVFQEDVLPMVLNTTNGKLIASITGSDETDEWHGHQIVLYNDPTISYAGKITGGIRARAPKKQAPRSTAAPAPATSGPAPAARPAPAPPAPVQSEFAEPDDDEDVPF